MDTLKEELNVKHIIPIDSKKCQLRLAHQLLMYALSLLLKLKQKQFFRSLDYQRRMRLGYFIYSQICLHNGPPFEVKIPNKQIPESIVKL